MDYKLLAEAYAELEKSPKRLKKTLIISELLKKTSETELQRVILLLQGRIFPAHDEREMGIASKIVFKAIVNATGHSSEKVEDLWRKLGDLGLVAEKLSSQKKQNTLFSEDLTVKGVFENLEKLSLLEGHGSVDQKVKIISRLLSLASSLEAKYVVRIALQDLRVGVAEGTLRDAIAWSYMEEVNPNYNPENDSINPDDREKYNESITILQEALDKTNDFLVVAQAAKKGIYELKKIKLKVGKPLKVMLAQKVTSVKDAFDTVGRPAVLEFKYDGFRMQVHKKGDEITIFTRRLDDVTKQFPEVRDYIIKNVKAEDCILDCEAAGYDSKTGKYTPFQHISQRIKRKYDIEKVAKELPIELNVFDILYYNGKDLLNESFVERRRIIEKIVKEVPKKIVLSKHLVTSSDEDAQRFFDESVKLGNEGLMFKNLQGKYKPGSRVGTMIKLKSSMDPLDVVIIGAEWGEGKRSGWFTSFTVACQSEDGFLELGKVGTGLKEKREEGLSFDEMTELLKPLIVIQKGRNVEVKPEIVVSILFEEIQKSPSYSSGYALRFPRFISLREDKDAEDAVSIEEIEDIFYGQKK